MVAGLPGGLRTSMGLRIAHGILWGCDLSSLRRYFLKLNRMLLPIAGLVVAWHATADAAFLLLQWTDNANNETGFKVERKTGTGGAFAQIATVGVNVTSYNDSSVNAGNTYCYRVRAYNSTADSAYTNEACGSPSSGQSFILTLTKTGAGSGTVTSSPAGIDCGATCVANFNSNQIVSLTPVAAVGSRFSGWSGDLDCSDATVTMTANKSCAANFSLANRAPVANAGADLTANEGELVTLTGAASSDPDGNSITYSWTQVGGPAATLTGANTVSPSLRAPTVGFFGALLTFQLAVTDTGGLTSADTVVVRVNSVVTNTITNSLVNVSTRSNSGSADNIMIVGFILEGTAPKTVLIRGLGPSMADVGLPGVMANPTLTLFSGSQIIASNDNWRDSQSTEILSTGLDPCQPFTSGGPAPTGCDLESAIYITLNPGAYTAHLRGAGGGTGIGLADVFAISEGGAELVNISTRSVAGVGDGIIIGGFIVEGTTPKTVLIRGRGPTLADFGVKGVLANPTLSLFSGQQQIASNNDWQDSQAAQISATGSDPCQPLTQGGPAPTGCTLESAILITLNPGVYTAQLSGVNGGTGVGLVEVFNLD